MHELIVKLQQPCKTFLTSNNNGHFFLLSLIKIVLQPSLVYKVNQQNITPESEYVEVWMFLILIDINFVIKINLEEKLSRLSIHFNRKEKFKPTNFLPVKTN